MVNRQIRLWADNQYGYVTARQALEAGYTNQLQRYHVTAGNWRRIAWGLYRLKGYADSLESDFTCWTLWATLKDRRRVAVVSHQSALYYYRLQEQRPAQVHLSVSSRRKSATEAGCLLYCEAIAAEDYVIQRGFSIMTPLRTLRTMKPELLLNGSWAATVRGALRRGLIDERAACELLGRTLYDDAVAGAEGIAAGGMERADGCGAADRAGTEGLRHIMTGQRRMAREAGAWRPASRSFTLVEMLVVIAIMAILASLLMPALQNAVEMGRRVSCQNNLSQAGIAWQMYVDDNQGELPTTGYSGTCGWAGRLYPGVTSQSRVLFCPSDVSGGRFTYSVNGNLYVSAGAYWKGVRRAAAFPRPGVTFLMVEAPNSSRQNYTDGSYSSLERLWQINSGGPWMHSGQGAEYLYLDGHAGWFATPVPVGSTWPPAVTYENWGQWSACYLPL